MPSCSWNPQTTTMIPRCPFGLVLISDPSFFFFFFFFGLVGAVGGCGREREIQHRMTPFRIQRYVFNLLSLQALTQ